MSLPSMTSRPVKTVEGFASGWNAAHNPIVYKITNDKWPTNSLDAAENITDHDDAYGNAQFTIASHGFQVQQWVTVASSDIEDYNGVWRIVAADTNTITLDLPYQAGAIGSPTALRYYQNYHTLIEVYVGVPAGHALNADDPMAFSATLRSVPNASNVSIVDVSEIVREHLFMTNSQEPNDINLWTAFYVKYAESYDEVSGTYPTDDLYQFISEYTSDALNTLYGVHAKMAFQYPYGGNMGEFVLAASHEGAFLTKFERPTMWRNRYFDLAFLMNEPVVSLDFTYTQYNKLGANLGSDSVAVVDFDEGVYRVRTDNISYHADTAWIRCRITGGGNTAYLFVDVQDMDSCGGLPVLGDKHEFYLTWLNHLGGFDYWNFTAYADYGMEFGDEETYKINVFEDWDTNFINGQTVENYNKIEAYRNVRVRSQLLTRQQAEGIANIKTSPLVQLIDGDKITTVMVDKDNFVIIEEEKKIYSVNFQVRFTDMIPSQNA